MDRSIMGVSVSAGHGRILHITFPLFRDLFDDLRGGEGDSGER